MADVNGSPPDQNGGSNYITIAIGLITAGAILASVVVAAHAALVLQKMNNFQTGFGQMGVLAAVASVAAYVGTVFYGLAALIRPTASLRSRDVWRATNAFFGQASTAGILAFAVMVGPVFAGTCLNQVPETTQAVQEVTVRELLDDARLLHARAIESLERGHVREAAAIAWLSTVRATDAVLATSTEYTPAGVQSRASSLNNLAQDNSKVENLAKLYQERSQRLQESCSFGGLCGPEIEDMVRETEQYISDAARISYARIPFK